MLSVNNYLRLGCNIIKRYPRLYATTDSHFLLQFIVGISKPIRGIIKPIEMYRSTLIGASSHLSVESSQSVAVT